MFRGLKNGLAGSLAEPMAALVAGLVDGTGWPWTSDRVPRGGENGDGPRRGAGAIEFNEPDGLVKG